MKENCKGRLEGRLTFTLPFVLEKRFSLTENIEKNTEIKNIKQLFSEKVVSAEKPKERPSIF